MIRERGGEGESAERDREHNKQDMHSSSHCCSHHGGVVCCPAFGWC